MTVNPAACNLSSGPLLRFIPIILVWIGDEQSDLVARMTSVADRACVVALQLDLPMHVRLEDAAASALLQAPCLQRLHSLTLGEHTRRIIELACQLPLLATLKLRMDLTEEDAAMLSAAPSLTHLSVGLQLPRRTSTNPKEPSIRLPLAALTPSLRISARSTDFVECVALTSLTLRYGRSPISPPSWHRDCWHFCWNGSYWRTSGDSACFACIGSS